MSARPYRWGGLLQGRTLRTVVRVYLPSGHYREVPLTHQDLLELIGDAAHALAKLEQARAMNAARDTPSVPT